MNENKDINIESNINKDQIMNEENLKNLRNIIIGSYDNKVQYLINNQYKIILEYYINNNQLNLEELNKNILLYIIAIINSYIISHKKLMETNSDEMNNVIKFYPQLFLITTKYLNKFEMNQENIKLYENSFHLLENLSSLDFVQIEQNYLTDFLKNVDKFIMNDSIFVSICVILSKIIENNYFKPLIIQNQNLINKLINKFFSSRMNIKIVKILLKLLIPLTHENETFCKEIINNTNNFSNVITSCIRQYDVETSILAIKLMTNLILNQKLNDNEIIEKINNFPIILWSVKILLDFLNQNKINLINNKINCVSSLSNLLIINEQFRIHFVNLKGIDIILKEFKNLYSESEIKKIDEEYKNFKEQKAKISSDEDAIISNETVLNKNDEYKTVLLNCLFELCENSEKKEDIKKDIMKKNEFKIIIYIISETNNHHKLLLSAILLILSLSRGKTVNKKELTDHGVNILLMKLTKHPNIDIQIQTTNALCNFLLEEKSLSVEIIKFISKLKEIFLKSTHSKIRFNSICAIKNIFYSVNSKNEIKKNIVKKITYDFLLELLDDNDIQIQIQSLLIFRVLLFKNKEDIEDVFSNCKDKLLHKILEKISNKKISEEIIIHSLYVLSNISNGSENQKKSITKPFLEQIVNLVNHNNIQIKLVCLIILNNLFINEDIKKIILEFTDLIPNLEKISTENNEIKVNDKFKIEYQQIKQLSIDILGIIKNKKT